MQVCTTALCHHVASQFISSITLTALENAITLARHRFVRLGLAGLQDNVTFTSAEFVLSLGGGFVHGAQVGLNYEFHGISQADQGLWTFFNSRMSIPQLHLVSE
ncbi:MAG: hypothetical protein RR574_09240 [Comamonas sp.]